MKTLDEIIELTSQLIAFKTMHSCPEEIAACAAFIMKWCAQNEIHATLVEHNGVPSIMVMPDAKNKAKLAFMAHIDVVDADDALFTPRIEGDTLHGRGAGDDKYAVALSLILFRDHLKALRAQGLNQKNMVFGVIITGDEETGGVNGAAHVLPLVQCDYVIALDGGSPHRMVLQEKGIINLTITARGKAAHGARPWLGVNAIDILIKDYAAIKKRFTGTDPNHWHPTVNLGIIHAGESVNQVPGEAVAQLDIRYTEHDDPEAIITSIRNVVKSEVLVERIEPVFASPKSPYTERLLALAHAEAVQEHGASDARYLQDNGMAGVVWGAEVFGSIHTAHECVSISSIGFLHEKLTRLISETEKVAHFQK